MNDLRNRFNILKDEWEKDTAICSSMTIISEHPAYQEIISMGEEALPLIFEELEKEVGHWFWALHVITGENVIPDEDRGYMQKMREHWLAWGRNKGYTK